MERKTWVKPMTLVQKFEANEPVAAIQCVRIACDTEAAKHQFWHQAGYHDTNTCGNPDKYVFADNNNNDLMDSMTELSNGFADPDHPCTIYTDNSYETTTTLENFKIGDTVYWKTYQRGSWGTEYYHLGILQSDHDNKS